ncbi:MAG: AsmA family protein [Candidatus Polarisedimenticolia bacterium]
MVTDPAPTKTRKRWPVRLAWAALVVVVLVAVAALILPRFIDVNTYRPLIQSKAEEALGRPVTLGEMSLSVFPSIAIRVENPHVEGLLSAQSLDVGVRLMPLLRGSVELRHVVLRRPELTLARRADGTWDLGSPARETQAAPPSTEAPATQAEGTSFQLSHVKIDQGVVHLTLHAPGGGIVQEDLAADLEGALEGEGLSRLSGEITGTLRGGGVEMALDGSFTRTDEETALDLSRFDASVIQKQVRRLATAAGMEWPLPDGVMGEGELKVSTRMEARLPKGQAAHLELRGTRLEGIDLLLARDARGRWNVASLLQPPAAPAPGAPGTAPAPEIVIHDAVMKGARVRLRDAAAVPGGPPVEVALTDVDLGVKELQPRRPIDLTLSARVDEHGSLKVEGTLPASLGSSAEVDARVTLERISLGALTPYLRTLTGMAEARAGTLSSRTQVSGTWPDRVRGQGTLEVNGVVLAAGKKPIDAQATFDLTALESAARTEIASLRAASGGSELEVRGWIDNREGATRLDLTVPPASVAADDVLGILAVAGVMLPMEISSSHPIEIEAHVRGEAAPRRQLSMTGRVGVKEATLMHPSMTEPMRKVSGTVMLRDDGFEVSGFSALIGRSDVAGTLAVKGFDSPKATFQLTSRHAEFWELMSFLRETPQQAAPAGNAAAPAPQTGPGLADKLAARGTLKIGEGSFGTLDFTGLSATLTLANRRLQLEPVEMKLYGGGVSGAASMDMRAEPPVYTVTTGIRSVDVDALLADNLGMKGTLTGALSGDVSVSSSGTSQQEALRRASGSGDVRILKGRVGPINVLEILSRASDVLGERSLEELSEKLAKQGTEFSELTATLKVSGGKVRTDNLHLISPDIELKDEGSLDMMAATLEIAGEILLSEEISLAMKEEGSKAVDYFWDSEANRVNLPLTLEGPITAPMPSIDWGTASGKLARRRIEEKLGEKLGGSKRLGELLGRGGSSKESEKAAPTKPGTGQVEPARAAEGLSIVIDEKRFSGNLLRPDLKIKGSLRGTGISSGSVLVKSEKGEVLLQESLDERIASFYATADRAAPVVIPFRLTLESRKSMGMTDDVLVTVTIQDEQGRSSEKTFRVER